MPSLLLSNASGGQQIISGAFYSGAIVPIGSVLLRLDTTALGNAYVGLSGNITITSGQLASSGQPNAGSGLLDGMLVRPGETYTIPRLGFGRSSGIPSIYVATDAVASGQARMYWEIF
ncbi:MAG: hypothetical protein KGL39_00200 [Patescibacteria group bacterium]|nr:hypothetical protein [Patescibacteria group bacterium]